MYLGDDGLRPRAPVWEASLSRGELSTHLWCCAASEYPHRSWSSRRRSGITVLVLRWTLVTVPPLTGKHVIACIWFAESLHQMSSVIAYAISMLLRHGQGFWRRRTYFFDIGIFLDLHLLFLFWSLYCNSNFFRIFLALCHFGNSRMTLYFGGKAKICTSTSHRIWRTTTTCVDGWA